MYTIWIYPRNSDSYLYYTKHDSEYICRAIGEDLLKDGSTMAVKIMNADVGLGSREIQKEI